MKKFITIALATIALAATTLVAIPALANNVTAQSKIDGNSLSGVNQSAQTFENAGLYMDYGAAFCNGGLALGDEVTLQRVADTLGITYAQLVERLQNGETVAAIATAQEVDLSKVVDTMVAAQTDMVNVLVKYGYVTQDEANAIIAALRTRVESAISASAPAVGDSDEGYGCGGPFGYEKGAANTYGYGMMGGYAFGNGTGANSNSRYGMMGW